MLTIRDINKNKFMLLFEKRRKNYRDGIVVLYKKHKGCNIITVHKPIKINTDSIYIDSDNLQINLNFDNIKEYKASKNALYLITKDNHEVVMHI